MKILHVSISFLPQIGGAEVAIHNIALQQHLLGHDVSVLTGWNKWVKIKNSFSYRVIPFLPKTYVLVSSVVNNSFNLNWLLGTQLAFYIKIFKFDICHVHFAYLEGYSLINTLKKMRIPSILTCHGGDINKYRELNYGIRLNPMIDEYIKETLPKFNTLTAVSESIKTEYLKLGISSNKIVSIPNGTNVSKIISLKVNVKNIRRKYGIPIDKYVFLSIGRNNPIKGYQYIPPIIKYLLKFRKDFIWVLFGKGTDSLKNMAVENGVGSYLKVFQEIGINKESVMGSNDYLFPSKDVIEIYKAADIFIFPSLMESFGMVLLEAMAAGLPIVTTNAPGCRDLVKHEVNGLISPVGDIHSMAFNILRLLEDDVLMKNIGKNGINKSKLYEWENIADKYLKVYSTTRKSNYKQ